MYIGMNLKVLQLKLIISFIFIIVSEIAATNDEDFRLVMQKIDELTTELKDMKQTIKKNEEENYRMTSEIKRLQDEVKQTKRDCEINTKPKQDIDSKVKRLLLGDNDADTVAFTATLTHHVALGANQAVQYDKTITNIGNAYDPRHGHMIAPIKGIYLVSVTVFSFHSQADLLELVNNGNVLVHLFTEASQYAPMSQTVIVALEKSDVVWVRNNNDSGYAGHQLYGAPNRLYNTFSGYLLKAL